MDFPLPETTPEAVGLDALRLERMCQRVEADIAEGRHPGAQLAVARHGKIALFRNFGEAAKGRAATPETLWLLYSNTKVVTAAGLWALAEEGMISLTDPVARYLPGFEAEGKGGITFLQLLTHQAGFPSAVIPEECWEDPEALRRTVCAFPLEWEPGSRVRYHPASAHWVAAAVIRAVTGEDHRDFLRRRLIAPLGLERELFVGLPDREQGRAADMHDPDGSPRQPECGAAHRKAGVPGGGGYGTARAMAAFYQCLLAGGAPILSRRVVQYALKNRTGDRVDEYNGIPMHRGLGPHLRGTTAHIRGIGTLAHPDSFGHGGVGSSYCWGDPDSGVSFAFLSNTRADEEFHTARMERLSNMVHASIRE
ncbi:serine hydrolase domain-containing protein [Sabulicella rubraurantiaca]|uniref:serine hydrolase domain-containing protein n=1 Tax=Sabulicella rubraurantiaca TaxID=2811429 RepID=UPI001A97760D|nr:serine hydrolase domain-containing protein [Sabulicella rubraurantiaca]